jgi:hypothetical protein
MRVKEYTQKQDIISRFNRLPKTCQEKILYSIQKDEFANYHLHPNAFPLMATIGDYQLHFTYTDYKELKEYIRTLKLNRILDES